MFILVHPTVIDLYITSLEQEELAEVIDGYGSPDKWPPNVSEAILNIAHAVTDKHSKALKAVGSEIGIDNQLDIFWSRGGRA